MSVILTNSLRKPISCCVYVTGSTNLTTRVKSVYEKRLWGVVAIKKCVNCQFEMQKWKVAPWRRKNVESESDEEQELHTETHQCEEWEKVSKILNLPKTPTFETFMVFDSKVQVCGLWTDDDIFS
ncbi:hypothetical protein AVEN_199742-1 [Araneus ventricosus]|uniref:Uncharacterized protein n=1 Tax=Araneus ventricosus TaxID=182803 RepID=A0A4Y2SGV0_ARAVE|nr:hypothetical protein AVEN_199742-1 [Araneus ventricosus]